MAEILEYINNCDSISELKEFLSNAENRISKLRKSEIQAARKKIQDMAIELDVNIADLVPQGISKIPTKYVNPKDNSQTWSGRGKKPVWITKALDEGAKLEDFEV